MKSKLFFSLLIIITFSHELEAQSALPKVSPMTMEPEMTEIWEPEVALVAPGIDLGDAPSDAIVLFDGTDLEHWASSNDDAKPAPWKIVDNNHMEVVPESGGIQTKMKFGDCQFHIEFSAPDKVEGESQGRGNSGVFFQKKYELQILDSYNNRTYRNGQAASIYKDHAPLVNAMRSPLEWNTYDVIYMAPRFKEDGRLDAKATITVLHNGVLVQNHSIINGITYYAGLHDYPTAHRDDVISLQDHGNKTQFRNIWIRKL